MLFICLTSANEVDGKPNYEILDTYIERIAQDKDKNALAEIYHLTSASVFGFALSIVKNMHDAEDVLHDTYICIFSSAAKYKKMGKPMAWILTMTRNLCLMKLRDREKTSQLPQEDWEKYLGTYLPVTPEDKMVLKACIEKLSSEESQIVMLHAVSGFKHREIAEVLSLPLSTVLSKYSRALKKMKNLLLEGESI